MKLLNIHLAGAGGKGNLGAESIALAMVRLFRRALGPCRFRVSAWKPGRMREVLAGEPDVAAVRREGALPSLRDALESSAYVVCGDVALTESVVSFLPVYWAAKTLLPWLLRRTVIFFGIEAEAVRRPMNRLAVRVLGLTTDLFVVRNRVSAENLAALGLPANKVVVGCDPSLTLEDGPALSSGPGRPGSPSRDLAGADSGLLVGFGIRDYFGAAFRFDPLRLRLVRRDGSGDAGHPEMGRIIEGLARLGRRLIEAHGARLVFVPHHFLPPAERVIRPDADIARLAAERIGRPDRVHILPEELHPLEALALYRRCGLVVSMRHHATCFAVLGGAAVLALDIGAKIGNFLREADCPDQLIPPFAATDEDWERAADQGVEQRAQVAARLAAALAAMRADMDRAMDRMREALGR